MQPSIYFPSTNLPIHLSIQSLTSPSSHPPTHLYVLLYSSAVYPPLHPSTHHSLTSASFTRLLIHHHPSIYPHICSSLHPFTHISIHPFIILLPSCPSIFLLAHQPTHPSFRYSVPLCCLCFYVLPLQLIMKVNVEIQSTLNTRVCYDLVRTSGYACSSTTSSLVEYRLGFSMSWL